MVAFARMLRVWALAALVAVASCNSEPPAARPAEPSAPPAPAAEPAPRATPAEAPAVVFAPQGRPEARVTVDVVSTPRAIQRGLMYRRHLPPDHGMLFVFPDERVRSFWMKNTLLPLDMIFVRDDGSVAGVVADTEPMTLDSRSVGIPTRYVLEVNAGWAARHGIVPGTRMRLENLRVEPLERR